AALRGLPRVYENPGIGVRIRSESVYENRRNHHRRPIAEHERALARLRTVHDFPHQCTSRCKGAAMLSIGKCRDLDYYEREVIDGREDYLSESGSAPGRWVGRMAAADGLTGVADRDALAAAFGGAHPDESPMALHRRHVAGFDLTLSPSKSVSLVWALGTEHDARQVE